jgi:hypothetical protein
MTGAGHFAASQGMHTSFTHCPLSQSTSTEHGFPAAHLGHAAPPQSTPVSVPSFIEFEHVAAGRQKELVVVFAMQLRLAQSSGTLHEYPMRHAQPPPQSIPVSMPFSTPSVHDGAAHSLFAHTCV